MNDDTMLTRSWLCSFVDTLYIVILSREQEVIWDMEHKSYELVL